MNKHDQDIEMLNGQYYSFLLNVNNANTHNELA